MGKVINLKEYSEGVNANSYEISSKLTNLLNQIDEINEKAINDCSRFEEQVELAECLEKYNNVTYAAIYANERFEINAEFTEEEFEEIENNFIEKCIEFIDKHNEE